MIMRLALARIGVVMRADAEAELGILIEDVALAGARPVMRGDESLVLACLLDEGAHLFAPLDAGSSLQRATAFRCELLECQAHKVLLSPVCRDSSARVRGSGRNGRPAL